MSAASNIATVSFKLTPLTWPLDGVGGYLRASAGRYTTLQALVAAEGKTVGRSVRDAVVFVNALFLPVPVTPGASHGLAPSMG